MSEPLWTPPEAQGKTYYGGPGDGFYFFFFLALPALAFGIIHVIALFWVVRSALRRRSFWPVLAYVLVSGLWVGALLFEHHQMTQGVRVGS